MKSTAASNPFTISFGKQPLQFISRLAQSSEILEDFQSPRPSSQVYMITGVRGTGKTVMMTALAHQLEDEGWIVIDLNPHRDMLNALAGKLYDTPELNQTFLKARLNLSAFGIGVSIQNTPPISDIETGIRRMLDHLEKKNLRLLITIDEVISNPEIRVFVSVFQSLLREDYPVFLLMTGLYDNLYNLQNEPSLTFLYRAPKVLLEPLNLAAIQASYQKIFSISAEEASSMARLTMGYSFAFQVLGYLRWKHQPEETLTDLIPEFDQYLEEYVYEKIWSELSNQDQRILTQMVRQRETRTGELAAQLDMTPQHFYVYKKRLERKGIVDTSTRGHISFFLPRFAEFVSRRTEA